MRAAGLFLIAALTQATGIDLTDCEAVDVSSRADGQVVVIIWRCPDAQAWAVRYQATGARPALLAKPAPSPSPTP